MIQNVMFIKQDIQVKSHPLMTAHTLCLKMLAANSGFLTHISLGGWIAHCSIISTNTKLPSLNSPEEENPFSISLASSSSFQVSLRISGVTPSSCTYGWSYIITKQLGIKNRPHDKNMLNIPT